MMQPRGFGCPRHPYLPEVNPRTGKLFIRGYKVTDEHGDWSQCLVCSGFYQTVDARLGEYVETPHLHNKEKGWFCS